MDWSLKEVSLIVSDYFNMLQYELRGVKYNKSAFRRALMPMLNKRTNGSIEAKHQNISAVLIQLGLPFISGYKPLPNYQGILKDEVIAKLKKSYSILQPDLETFVNNTLIKPVGKNQINFNEIVEQAPVTQIFSEPEPTYKPIKINYLEREQNNRILGEQGEELILNYEKWNLIKLGKEKLAEQIEWVSKEQGDGLGFDILSKNTNGTDKFIEVKTTKLSKETPIFLTQNELSFSKTKSESFYLYRLFKWGNSPKFFLQQGSYDSFCSLESMTYRGHF